MPGNGKGKEVDGSTPSLFGPREVMGGTTLARPVRIPRGVEAVIRPEFIALTPNRDRFEQEDGTLLPLSERPLMGEIISAGLVLTGMAEDIPWHLLDQPQPHRELWQYRSIDRVLTIRGRAERSLGNGFKEVVAYPEDNWVELGRSFFSQFSHRPETEIHYIEGPRSVIPR